VVRLRLLQNHPHALDIVARVTPIAPGIEIADEKLLLQPCLNCGYSPGDLARHKCFAPDRAFMVKQHPVRSVDVISLAIVHSDPIGVKFGGSIGATWCKWSFLVLRAMRRVAVEL